MPVVTSEIERKHTVLRAILTLCAKVRRALAIYANLHGVEIADLNDFEVADAISLSDLSPEERHCLTQLGWVSAVGVREFDVIATGISRVAEPDPKSG
jgi:hypothetical protein